MWHKRKWVCIRIAIMLLFILFVLFCLDGEAYANCKHVFPDEVMDLQGHFLSPLEAEFARIHDVVRIKESLQLPQRIS